jgi:hypothetical protein
MPPEMDDAAAAGATRFVRSSRVATMLKVVRRLHKLGDRVMRAIRIRKTLDSQVLDLPELADLLGRTVEIIVLDEECAPDGAPDLAALDAISGRDVVDEAAIRELRRVSTI